MHISNSVSYTNHELGIMIFIGLQNHVPGMLKENICYPQLSQEDSSNEIVNSGNEPSRLLQKEVLCHGSPTSSNTSYQSQLLQNSESRYNRVPLQQSTTDLSRKVEETVMTPDTDNNYKTRRSNPNASSGKGSHIRKSLHTIGKLINGCERR